MRYYIHTVNNLLPVAPSSLLVSGLTSRTPKDLGRNHDASIEARPRPLSKPRRK